LIFGCPFFENFRRQLFEILKGYTANWPWKTRFQAGLGRPQTKIKKWALFGWGAALFRQKMLFGQESTLQARAENHAIQTRANALQEPQTKTAKT
jgi:hypothetical protein